MKKTETTRNNIFVDIWTSFRALPVWVQVWMMLILAPINLASLAFIDQPQGRLVTFLALAGMVPGMGALVYDRGFSRLTAISHIVPWTILVVMLLVFRPEVTGYYNTYLSALLTINLVSLLFDYPETVKWFRGEREVWGRA